VFFSVTICTNQNAQLEFLFDLSPWSIRGGCRDREIFNPFIVMENKRFNASIITASYAATAFQLYGSLFKDFPSGIYFARITFR
jgi:hypothetical protein